MKYLLDTNIYLDAFRSQENKDQFRQAFFPLLPSTFFSAVVAYELHVNAWNGRTRDALGEFIHPLERAGRVVHPPSTIGLKHQQLLRKLSARTEAGGQRFLHFSSTFLSRCAPGKSVQFSSQRTETIFALFDAIRISSSASLKRIECSQRPHRRPRFWH